VVTFTFVAAGTVSDFDDTKKYNLRYAFAVQAGVDVNNVVITITAASVNIQVDIVVADTVTGNSVVSALASSFTDAAALTTLLSNAAVTVESITTTPTVTTKTVVNLPPALMSPPPPSPPPSPPTAPSPVVVVEESSSSIGGILGGVGGGLCAIGILSYLYMKKKQSADKVRV